MSLVKAINRQRGHHAKISQKSRIKKLENTSNAKKPKAVAMLW